MEKIIVRKNYCYDIAPDSWVLDGWTSGIEWGGGNDDSYSDNDE